MYSKFIKKLSALCQAKNLILTEIKRTGQNEEYPLFAVTNQSSPASSPIANDRHHTVCFCAGIHGDEIAGPLAILHIIKEFNFASLKTKVIIFPVANPFGFDHRVRLNHDHIDLNHSFCKKAMPQENRILLHHIQKEKIFFFHSLHEDMDETRFYTYCFESKPAKIYRQIIKLAQSEFPINKDQQIYGDNNHQGLIINSRDGSFEDKMFRLGAKYSMCTETPGQAPLEKRIRLNVNIMKQVINFTDSFCED